MSDSTYEGWVVVFKSGTDYEADLVRNRLDDAGIPAMVLSQRDHAFNLTIGDLAQVQVLVLPAHVATALEVLATVPASDESGDESGVDHRYDRTINACFAGAFVLGVLGLALGNVAQGLVLLLGLPSAVLVIIGLSLVARKKGRDWKWGFMGGATVAALKDRQPDENPAATWKCQKCGEDIEDSFGTCWKCGTDRDG